MEDVAFSHQAQTKKHLLGVSSNSSEVDSYIASKLLQYFSEVDTEIFKNHAQVAFVLKVSLKTNHVLLVVGVGLIDLLKDLDLLHASFSPTYGQSYFQSVIEMSLHCLIVSDEFDSNQLLRRHIRGSNNPRKHTFPEICLNMISAIQQLAQNDFVISFNIIPVI